MMSTVYAMSSGAPPAAIAVIRVSGPRAASVLEALAGACPPPRRMTAATLKEQGEHLDRALILFFPGPGSATGEDLAELHLHGGRATIARVLAALSRIEGLAPAAPGEFTRRAFENGRIDLAEAEGLSDLLFAETEQQRRAALAMAEGQLSREVLGWQERVVQLSARVEAQLDFADEDDVGIDASIGADIELIASELRFALGRPSAERLRDGVRVAIAGPPNVGKSTLLNALAGRDAAIVSDVAGTTRDVIEVPIILEGRAMILIDLAGLRDEASDKVEQLGIERARDVITRSDVVLWLGGPADAPAGAVMVWPRCDEAGRGSLRGGNLAKVSARTGEGMNSLTASILERIDRVLPCNSDAVLTARQRGDLAEAALALASDDNLLIVAENLRRARLAFDRLLGKRSVEEMLDALFGRFCIGK